jgi:tetratricopeptide (TPR) repeat protein
MMAVYVALCFLYGGAFLLGNVVDMQTSRNALFGFGTASTFLHFYYDGFIWKVREKSTRVALGLKGGASAAETFPGWAVHGAKWMLFVVPACALWYAEVHGKAPVVERYENIVEAVPESSPFHYRLGLARQDYGDAQGALAAFDRAIEIDPASEAHVDLADMLHSRGQKAEALEHYQTAIDANPRSAKAHYRFGAFCQSDGRAAEAEERFSRALELKPKYADAHFALASLLQSLGRTDEAIDHLRAATAIKPDFTEANLALGNLLQVRRQATGAPQ